MEEELWRPVVGWPEYEVSNQARVRRKSSRKILAQFEDESRNGGIYMRVQLSAKLRGKTKLAYVHVIVARAWVPGHSETNNSVDHRDMDRANNRPSNLRWVPGAYNSWRANQGRYYNHWPEPSEWSGMGPLAADDDGLPY